MRIGIIAAVCVLALIITGCSPSPQPTPPASAQGDSGTSGQYKDFEQAAQAEAGAAKDPIRESTTILTSKCSTVICIWNGYFQYVRTKEA
jgi:PBP1b-binding outer membrane lipoprotein LpoB